jgi:hypothetical protein
VHAFAQHSRAARDPGRNELRDRNGQIAEQCRLECRGVVVPCHDAPHLPGRPGRAVQGPARGGALRAKIRAGLCCRFRFRPFRFAGLRQAPEICYVAGRGNANFQHIFALFPQALVALGTDRRAVAHWAA